MKILFHSGCEFGRLVQRPSLLAEQFAWEGWDVHFISTNRKEHGQLKLLSNGLPDAGIEKIYGVVGELRSQPHQITVMGLPDADIEYDVLWCSFGAGAKQASLIQHKHLVFDNLDTDWGNPAFIEGEKWLREKASLIFCTAKALAAQNDGSGKPIVMLPNAVDLESYTKEYSEPDDLKAIPHPRFVFMGALARWIDPHLLVLLASVGYQVVLIGPPYGASLPEHENIHNLGEKPYEQLPAYLFHCQVGVLPFFLYDVSLKADPLKAYQYLAAGLPVLATPLPELDKFDNRYVIQAGRLNWLEGAETALKQRANHLIHDSVKEHTWEHRIKTIKQAFQANGLPWPTSSTEPSSSINT